MITENPRRSIVYSCTLCDFNSLIAKEAADHNCPENPDDIPPSALNSQILFGDATDSRAIFQPHVVDAHAKYLTGKWFRWLLSKGDRVLAKADLQRRYERYNSRDSG